jgi:hypothetical protein
MAKPQNRHSSRRPVPELILVLLGGSALGRTGTLRPHFAKIASETAQEGAARTNQIDPLIQPKSITPEPGLVRSHCSFGG